MDSNKRLNTCGILESDRCYKKRSRLSGVGVIFWGGSNVFTPFGLMTWSLRGQEPGVMLLGC